MGAPILSEHIAAEEPDAAFNRSPGKPRQEQLSQPQALKRVTQSKRHLGMIGLFPAAHKSRDADTDFFSVFLAGNAQRKVMVAVKLRQPLQLSRCELLLDDKESEVGHAIGIAGKGSLKQRLVFCSDHAKGGRSTVWQKQMLPVPFIDGIVATHLPTP